MRFTISIDLENGELEEIADYLEAVAIGLRKKAEIQHAKS